jgi:chromosome partitioning protein
MFMERLSLYELDGTSVNGLASAIDNAIHLTAEVLELLRKAARSEVA